MVSEIILDELIKKHIISSKDRADVTRIAKEKNQSILLTLNDLKLISEDDLEKVLANLYGLKTIDTNINALNLSLVKQCETSFLNDNRIVPYALENGVVIAVIDNPNNLFASYALQSILGKPVVVSLVSKESLDSLLQQVTFVDRRNRAIDELNKEDTSLANSDDDINKYISAPAVALANTLLEEAVSLGASDIHIEPMLEEVRVRYRIDGVLVEHCRIGSNLYQSLLARYKIMSQLDIAERRIPQDGKISMDVAGDSYDFRVSTLPNIYGEKIVIRVYNTLGDQMTVDKLASDKNDERKIRNLIRSPHGIILLSGPTGSGKTTTLYAFLKELNKPGVNIQTVEDPVENQIAGANQLQVNTKTGLTFASSLRSILRQDPNIIMIGEIRDEETAHIAVQAAITGHLVFSSIHTNDAVTTVARLVDMGVEPYLVSDSLAGSISQRLMRKLCPHCKKEHIVNEHEEKLLNVKKGTKIYEPVGCLKCNHTGYKGRIAVFEIMEVGNGIKSAIDNRKLGAEDLLEAAKKDGLIPLRVRAAELVKDGITSVEEFNGLISHIGEE